MDNTYYEIKSNVTDISGDFTDDKEEAEVILQELKESGNDNAYIIEHIIKSKSN